MMLFLYDVFYVDVVTTMLKVFFIKVYVLLDPGATISFINHFVAKKFDIFPNVLSESFSVCIQLVIR